MGWVILIIVLVVISAIVGATKYGGAEAGAGVFMLLLWFFGVLVSLGIPIALIYMAWHFAHKYW